MVLRKHISKEYLQSFVLSFIFFFFIFFVNQILVLAQKIILKNVSIADVLYLVILSIPQFLMYTMPFSSLASASMTIGSLTSDNEILAMRASGIHTFSIFKPILVISLIFSAVTLLIADKMIPLASQQYKNVYTEVLQKVPTLELESYTSTSFSDKVISNGLVEGNKVYNIIIFDDSDSSNSRIISADKATVTIVDLDKFIYRIDLENPSILINDSSSSENYSYSKAESLSLYLNLSKGSSISTSLSPSQMSLKQLLNASKERKSDNKEIIENSIEDHYRAGAEIGDYIKKIEELDFSDSDINKLYNSIKNYNDYSSKKYYSFYYQYYKSEFFKKLALSFACTCLVFMAFPISFFKVRYGRLIGFGLSMLIACAYWFFLFYMQVRTVSSSVNPFLLIWLPNILILSIGIFLLYRLAKK